MSDNTYSENWWHGCAWMVGWLSILFDIHTVLTSTFRCWRPLGYSFYDSAIKCDKAAILSEPNSYSSAIRLTCSFMDQKQILYNCKNTPNCLMLSMNESQYSSDDHNCSSSWTVRPSAEVFFVPIPAAVISFILESNAFRNDWKKTKIVSYRLKSSRKCLSSPVEMLCKEFAGYGFQSALITSNINLVSQ